MKTILLASATLAVVAGIAIKTNNTVQYVPPVQSSVVAASAVEPTAPVEQPVVEQTPTVPTEPVVVAPVVPTTRDTVKALNKWADIEWVCYDEIVQSKFTWELVTQAQLDGIDAKVTRYSHPCMLQQVLKSQPELLDNI